MKTHIANTLLSTAVFELTSTLLLLRSGAAALLQMKISSNTFLLITLFPLILSFLYRYYYFSPTTTLPPLSHYLSSFLIHLIIVFDYLGWIDSFHNSYHLQYHQYLINQLLDKEESSIPILYQHNLTYDSFYKASHGYTFPVVLKGSNNSYSAINIWNNQSWWMNNYGNNTVLCKDINEGIGVVSCTINDLFLFSHDTATPATPSTLPSTISKKKKYYIVGEAKLFQSFPELQKMLNSSTTNLHLITPKRHVFTQLFMGYGGMGSDVHSALGCNFFHQIVGKKKWWVFPPSQLPYLIPSMNKNGLSIYTLTRLGSGKVGTLPSSWLNKLERYTTILEPGDILFDAPWFWHGVENLGNEDDLVIGVASRYMTPFFSSSFANNWLFTMIGIMSIARDYGLNKFLSSPDSFQKSLETSRNIQANRAKKE